MDNPRFTKRFFFPKIPPPQKTTLYMSIVTSIVYFNGVTIKYD